ncbi:MAG: TauD/TfdA family dioxygenase [Gammaproteobacteria bacterium]|nr:TauD/TfdA family dioxygenase [Gammaproteobacteria bacterium]
MGLLRIMENTLKNVNPPVFQHFSGTGSPFLLENESAYQIWRETRLEHYRCLNPARIINIADASSFSVETQQNLATQMQAFNFAFFEIDRGRHLLSRKDFLKLGRRLGLHRFESSPDQEMDGVTALKAVDASDKRSMYIPYSSRALNWHTDGYYNPTSARIGAFLLYCVNPAHQGGDSFLLDHEMLYLQIRDTAPELLVALMDPAVMVVPANVQNGQVIRPAESGPVFSVDSESGRLAMRYSSRPRYISWKSDELTKQAVDLVTELLGDNEFAVSLKLKRGQGIICNNVLHGRKAYADGSTDEVSRLYYRARYYDTVSFADYA